MTTAVKNERLEKRFDKWDVDGNGVIERSDLEAEGHRILKAFGETPSSPQGRAVIDSFVGTFDYLAQKAGTQSLDRETFLRVIEKEVFQGGDAGFARVVRPMIQSILNVCDTDGDGEINPSEFARWVGAVGVDPSTAKAAFSQVDTNGNGSLTVDELVNAVKAYHFGTLDAELLG
ncbi:EF-hand domain-containing protein [Saccharothrix variisporea]|uniref:Ca2+-binding EF-hand superfamily protein n=1 Tax=Saccharothrix variisporea TaxID=543527 RepID=A0A495X1S6_9PSEU|nr:EF-hand domain-containing protein [Saccharothrix variisporea]RKT67509.1 Ca2+-binding EF-hand superfamily protein [Saccharothrix variisporea]